MYVSVVQQALEERLFVYLSIIIVLYCDVFAPKIK